MTSALLSVSVEMVKEEILYYMLGKIYHLALVNRILYNWSFFRGIKFAKLEKVVTLFL